MDGLNLHALIDQLPTELQKEVYDFAAFLTREGKPFEKNRVPQDCMRDKPLSGMILTSHFQTSSGLAKTRKATLATRCVL